jgi:hypothetical protein
MENPVKNLFKYFQKEPGHALTFGYVLLIFIGLIFDYFYYKGFNINVIQFVELDDLLLAPVQDIRVLICVFVFGIIMFLLIEFDIWWSVKHPDNYKKWYRFSYFKDPFSENGKRYRFFLFIFGFIAYIMMGASTYSNLKAKKVKQGKEDKIQITFNNPSIDSVYIKNKPLFFVGKTKSFVFVYDSTIKKTSILNVSEIQKIEFEK